MCIVQVYGEGCIHSCKQMAMVTELDPPTMAQWKAGDKLNIVPAMQQTCITDLQNGWQKHEQDESG